MTSKKPKDINWPVPLRERDNSLGVAVREYAQSTEETRGDAAVYTRVLAQVGRRSRRVPMIAAGLATAGVLAVVALVVLHRDAAVPTGTVASKSALFVSAPSPRLASTEAPPPTAQPSRTPPVSTPPIASIRLGTLPASLPAGTVDLVGQATAVLSPDAVASGRARAGNTEVVLSKGSIELRVLPRAPGQQFTVNAGPYRFTVVGIAFTVSQTRSRIELVVSEGKVVVSRGTKRLATVGAGAEWAVDMNSAANSAARKFVAGGAAELTVAEPVAGAGGRSRSRQPVPGSEPDPAPEPVSGVARVEPPSPTAPPLAPAPATPMAAAATFPTRAATPTVVYSPATPAAVAAAPTARAETPAPAAPAAAHRDCGQLAASKHAREAVNCYQDQAVQNGLAGETAQYEVARLWRDSLGEPGRALAALQTQRSRFPNGVLRTEADLSIIELLPRLGRHADALAESEQFLTAHPKAERSGEIHLLRGNIYREVLRDLDHAEREYARAAEAGGRVGDDSRFLHAVCLEALGRVDEARKAYAAYLLKPGATHAQEAKKRLEGLRP